MSTDYRARKILRNAVSTDTPEDWRAYLARTIDNGIDHQQAECIQILENPTRGNKTPALETLISTGGVWLERDNQKQIIHVHGVRLSPGAGYGQPKEAYTLSWAQQRLRHPNFDRWDINTPQFSQANATRLLANTIHPSGLTLSLPTVAEYHETLEALYKAYRLAWDTGSDEQLEIGDQLENMMHQDFHWSLTSDRLVHKKDTRIIRAYGRYDQEEIPMLNNVFHNSSLASISHQIATTLLYPGGTLSEAEDTYNYFFETNRIFASFPFLQNPDRSIRMRARESLTGDFESPVIITRTADTIIFDADREMRQSAFQGPDASPVRGCNRSKAYSISETIH